MRKYPYITFYCSVLLAIAISGTYFAGKHAADRWYAGRQTKVEFNDDGTKLSNWIDGESNTITDCDDCVIIGKSISIIHGQHLVAMSCSKETNGTVIEGHYRFENKEESITLTCSAADMGFAWTVKQQ